MRQSLGVAPSFSKRLPRLSKAALSLALATCLVTGAAQAEQAARSKKSRLPTEISEQLTRVQTTVLRYTGLIGLPAPLRHALRQDDAPAEPAQNATPCSNTGAASKVVPCLGLQQGAEPSSNVRFRFDLALKSTAAPKDAFAPQCPAGAPCSNSLAEQERLADALSGQRRYPVATLGMALSF